MGLRNPRWTVCTRTYTLNPPLHWSRWFGRYTSRAGLGPKAATAVRGPLCRGALRGAPDPPDAAAPARPRAPSYCPDSTRAGALREVGSGDD